MRLVIIVTEIGDEKLANFVLQSLYYGVRNVKSYFDLKFIVYIARKYQRKPINKINTSLQIKLTHFLIHLIWSNEIDKIKDIFVGGDILMGASSGVIFKWLKYRLIYTMYLTQNYTLNGLLVVMG